MGLRCNIKIEVNDLRQIGFTSLDIIQGKVTINLSSSISLSSIQVKLFGISKTTLEGGSNRSIDRVIKKEEMHLVLYETRTIFPVKESIDKDMNLRAGEHEFDFNFRTPLNNSCYDGKTNIENFKMFSKHNSNFTVLNINAPAHKSQILPPSLTDLGNRASITYYLRVTVKTSSFIKSNFSKTKTIKMTQFNGVDYLHRSRALNFVRKESSFKDKLPEIIAIKVPPDKPPILQNQPSPHMNHMNHELNTRPKYNKRRASAIVRALLFGADNVTSISRSRSFSSTPSPSPTLSQGQLFENVPTIDSHYVPFMLEARSYGFLQTVGHPLSVELFILSRTGPQKFLGIDGESSGLGAIYLKHLHIELVSQTDIRCQEISERLEQNILLCSLDTTVRLDLAHAKKSKALNEHTGNPLYEVKIPEVLYADAVVPNALVPSFVSCNLERRYKILIVAKFADSKFGDSKVLKTVDLNCNVTLLSGISPPFASETAPPTALLPSYEEVVRQS